MTRKLIWAGPWNARSSVAHWGMGLCRQLERLGCQVDILRTEVQSLLGLEPLPIQGVIHHAHAINPSELAQLYDGILLNIGNDYAFYGEGLGLLKAVAPLLILHDPDMDHFLAGWSAAGDQGGAAPPSGIGWFAAQASGVAVTDPKALAAAEAACSGPASLLAAPRSYYGMAAPGMGGGRLTVAVIGHLEQDFRLESLIHGIALSPVLRRRVTLRLIGHLGPERRDELVRLAQADGIQPPQFTGWLSEDVLGPELANIDVLCRLGDAAATGGLAALATDMLSGRPVLVSDQTAYEAIPDDAVLKCRTGSEAVDVAWRLEALSCTPGLLRRVGTWGRQCAYRAFPLEGQARSLIQASDEAIAAAPAIVAMRNLQGHLAWAGAGPDDPAQSRAKAAVEALVGRPLNAHLGR